MHWYIMATRRQDDKFVLENGSHNQDDFKREYESLANRIGGNNIRIFEEVHARPTARCVFTDDEPFMQEKEVD